MGTKIRANAFLPEYHSLIDLDGNISSGASSVCHENHIMQNGHNLDSLTSRIYKNGYLGYDMEKLRQTILKHELIFRNQLQELHRLYRKQWELMNEIKRREKNEDDMKKEKSQLGSLFSILRPDKITTDGFSRWPWNHPASSDRDAKLSIGSVWAPQRDVIALRASNLYFGRSRNMPDLNIRNMTDVSANAHVSDTGKLASPKKRTKIFGVEFFEGHDDPLEDSSNSPTTILEQKSQKFQKTVPQHNLVFANCQSKLKNSGGLPWSLRNQEYCAEPRKGMNNSYFMNLDSLQKNSDKFFRKDERADVSLQNSKQEKEISAPDEVNNGNSAKKNEDVKRNQLGHYVSELRHHIDLNLSLDNEGATSAPSLPTAVVKIATTEMDLEAPVPVEFDEDASPKVSFEECDKIAAEAMMAISLSEENKNLVDDSTCLKWFAKIILLNENGDRDEEEIVPDGMDYFEFMTLKLEDAKEKASSHKLEEVFKYPSDEEGGGPKSSRMFRRGQSRRGRQRIDFQKDVLPGLITLSRHEVTEDFQTFEELCTAEWRVRMLGFSKGKSMKNGRGRKRSARIEPPVFQLEEGCLQTGWGKSSRRKPRQRRPNAKLSFGVKC